MNTERYQQGLAIFNQIHGGHAGEELVMGLKDVAPDFANIIIEWGFGEMMTRKGLDLKTRELTIIASIITLGHALPQLGAHIEAALNVGACQAEIIEVIMQTALYAGFPAAVNAIYLAKDIFKKVGTS